MHRNDFSTPITKSRDVTCNAATADSTFASWRLCVEVRNAFTLIELLTVIAIIGILAAIIIPTVGKVRESAKNAQCLSNLRQLSLAVIMAAADNKDVFLPALDKSPPTILKYGSWTLDIQPYIGNPNASRYASAVMVCPSRNIVPPLKTNFYRSSYGGHPRIMVDLANESKPLVTLSQINRPSEIILVADCGLQTSGDKEGSARVRFTKVETANSGSTGVKPADADKIISDGPDADGDEDTYSGAFRFRHNNRLNAAFCDGHAKQFSKGTIKQRNLHFDF